MKIELLGFPELVRALQGATESLRLNAGILNNLNVFPVPDGDTGLNMLATVQPGLEAIGSGGCSSVPALLALLSDQATRNSRGNSGFILARFLSGLSESVGQRQSIGADTLARGFARGSYLARSSLLAPVEGTMITIIAAMAEAMADPAGRDIPEHLRRALARARERLFETPGLLPLLAWAGVVDAGALGFICFVDGLLCGLTGRKIAVEKEADYRFVPGLAGPEPTSPGRPARPAGPGQPASLTFRFCTELTVEKSGAAGFREIRAFLEQNGDSLAFIDEKQILKLHIHSDIPEKIVAEAEKLGKILRVKIDDMAEQLNQGFRPVQDHERLAVLAVIPGPGYEAIFRDLEAGETLLYGERLPSAGEILQALEAIEAENVILLPNDKNIVPAAMLAKEKSDKNVFVLPTANVVQGITCLYNYNEADSPQANIQNMTQGLGLAACLKVYKSERDTDFGPVRIRHGDYFVVEGESVLAAAADLAQCLCSALGRLDLSEKASLGFYCGEGFDAGLLAGLAERLRRENGHLELEQHFGGQKGCPLIISVE